MGGTGKPEHILDALKAEQISGVITANLLNFIGDGLKKTREIIIETFSRSQDSVKDGMDISLCSWDTVTNELQWSGANNPLYIISHQKSIRKMFLNGYTKFMF